VLQAPQEVARGMETFVRPAKQLQCRVAESGNANRTNTKQRWKNKKQRWRQLEEISAIMVTANPTTKISLLTIPHMWNFCCNRVTARARKASK